MCVCYFSIWLWIVIHLQQRHISSCNHIYTLRMFVDILCCIKYAVSVIEWARWSERNSKCERMENSLCPFPDNLISWTIFIFLFSYSHVRWISHFDCIADNDHRSQKDAVLSSISPLIATNMHTQSYWNSTCRRYCISYSYRLQTKRGRWCYTEGKKNNDDNNHHHYGSALWMYRKPLVQVCICATTTKITKLTITTAHSTYI